MFTGLIEEIGRLKKVFRQGEAMVLTITASKVLEGIALGDSIAVNGVCLTVIAYDQTSFAADVMPETFRRSNLQQLRPGQPLNLERAMQANGRFGGHIVQGHCDGMAEILNRQSEANAVVFTLRASEPESLRYIIPKGSITIDGVSLTVVDTSMDTFQVSIIPHTLAETALQHKSQGDIVNIECDVIGKYVDHLLHYREPAHSKPAGAKRLTADFLADNGFL
ncbi:riboflavin synthase [Paenibacillus protaetiae]|uniref:Riboflavin synthase n=1 Tax=Paenibacillus protaetiae TaxID=2509456 RepID=A0A4P6EWU1_9BACL|nr:riboflavin synthase [Paenibacillus protaetiae]QAY66209.1 riboflavin synthase [Paenibacillus protaetiae]